jgi:hypothetical protein
MRRVVHQLLPSRERMDCGHSAFVTITDKIMQKKFRADSIRQG